MIVDEHPLETQSQRIVTFQDDVESQGPTPGMHIQPNKQRQIR